MSPPRVGNAKIGKKTRVLTLVLINDDNKDIFGRIMYHIMKNSADSLINENLDNEHDVHNTKKLN